MSTALDQLLRKAAIDFLDALEQDGGANCEGWSPSTISKMRSLESLRSFYDANGNVKPVEQQPSNYRGGPRCPNAEMCENCDDSCPGMAHMRKDPR